MAVAIESLMRVWGIWRTLKGLRDFEVGENPGRGKAGMIVVCDRCA